jgi:TatD family-associated radical SAM protein
MVRNDRPKTVYWLDDRIYLNITNKCPNRCVFCFKNFKPGVGDFILKLTTEPSFEDVVKELNESMRGRVWKEIIFCGFGEPTARLDLLLELTLYVKERFNGLPIRVNTNGQGNLLNPNRNVVAELKAAGVERISVSLNAGDEDTYNEVCNPSVGRAFDEVLKFIQEAKKALEVEVTAVTTQEIDIHKVEALTKQLGVKFRLRQCVPCFW